MGFWTPVAENGVPSGKNAVKVTETSAVVGLLTASPVNRLPLEMTLGKFRTDCADRTCGTVKATSSIARFRSNRDLGTLFFLKIMSIRQAKTVRFCWAYVKRKQ
jgi:hypothetical protein